MNRFGLPHDSDPTHQIFPASNGTENAQGAPDDKAAAQSTTLKVSGALGNLRDLKREVKTGGLQGSIRNLPTGSDGNRQGAVQIPSKVSGGEKAMRVKEGRVSTDEVLVQAARTGPGALALLPDRRAAELVRTHGASDLRLPQLAYCMRRSPGDYWSSVKEVKEIMRNSAPDDVSDRDLASLALAIAQKIPPLTSASTPDDHVKCRAAFEYAHALAQQIKSPEKRLSTLAEVMFVPKPWLTRDQHVDQFSGDVEALWAALEESGDIADDALITLVHELEQGMFDMRKREKTGKADTAHVDRRDAWSFIWEVALRVKDSEKSNGIKSEVAACAGFDLA